jgi:hypothetical protein
MIRRPGHLTRAEKEMLYWVSDIDVMIEMKWTQEQMDSQPIVTVRRIKTLMEGRTDAEKQSRKK